MITEIQKFENAARIATADALLAEMERLPQAGSLLHRLAVLCIARFRSISGERVA